MKKSEKIQKNNKVKNTDFLGMFRNFFKASYIEKSQEEEIKESEETEKVKADLEVALKRTKKMENAIFKESVRVAVLNPVQVDKNKVPKVQVKEEKNKDSKNKEFELEQ